MDSIKLETRSFQSIKEDEEFSFTRKITADDVAAFANLTGDQNPLHMDEEYAKTTQFGKRVVHGMLLGGLFSTLVGMICPGKYNLFLGQNVQFREPAFIDDELLVQGKIMQKVDAARMLRIQTQILRGEDVIVDGESVVLVLPEN